MPDIEWFVRVEDEENDNSVMLDEGESPSAAAPLGQVLGSLVQQASGALPAGAQCEVEVGGQITRTVTRKASGGLRILAFEISLGGDAAKRSESNFRLTIRFTK